MTTEQILRLEESDFSVRQTEQIRPVEVRQILNREEKPSIVFYDLISKNQQIAKIMREYRQQYELKNADTRCSQCLALNTKIVSQSVDLSAQPEQWFESQRRNKSILVQDTVESASFAQPKCDCPTQLQTPGFTYFKTIEGDEPAVFNDIGTRRQRVDLRLVNLLSRAQPKF